MAIDGKAAYEQFLKNGYWPDEATRQAGLQYSGATYQNSGQANNPYGQEWNGLNQQYEGKSNAVDWGNSYGPTVSTPYRAPVADPSGNVLGAPGGMATPPRQVGEVLGTYSYSPSEWTGSNWSQMQQSYTPPGTAMNPALYGQPINISGNQFQFVSKNPDGTTTWRKQDGSVHKLTQDQFRQYAPDYEQLYYGANSPSSVAAQQGAGTSTAQGISSPMAGSPTGTSTAQGVQQPPFTGGSSLGLNAYSGGASNVQSAGGMPAPLGGQTPLADAMLQGYGMGLAPFNTQFYNQLGNSLFQQATQNLKDNVFPGMNSNAIMAGGYGQERSQLGMGVAADRMNQSVFNALIPQVTSGYENWLNRGVNTGQAAQQGLLGMNQLDINAYTAQNQAARGASDAAGVQSYTNPWATGIGTAISMWPFINSMFGSPTNPNQNRTIVEPA